MNDTERMALRIDERVRVVERAGDVRGDRTRHADGQALPASAHSCLQRPQIEPVQPGHDEERNAFVLALVENLHDTRMFEAHRERDLVCEERRDILGFDEMRKQSLDDEALADERALRGPREEQLGHSAAREGPEQLVHASNATWPGNRRRGSA